MPSGNRKPATPAEIARFGHIAAALRHWMATQKMTPHQLEQAVGAANAYPWLNSKGAPGPKFAAKLAKLTGIDVSDLVPRLAGKPVEAVPVVVAKQRVVAVVAPERRPVLSFDIDDTGMARVRLDVTLDLEQAEPLMRLLLDAKLVSRD